MNAVRREDVPLGVDMQDAQGLRSFDPYRALQLHPAAPRDLIEMAYWHLVSRRSPAPTESRIQDLNHAYATLLDVEARRAFDEALGLQDVPGPVPIERPRGPFLRLFAPRLTIVERDDDHYRLLRISTEADSNIIQLAYEYWNQHVGKARIDRALVEEAFRTLSHPQMRAQYDARMSGTKPSPENSEITKQFPSQIQITSHNEQNGAKVGPKYAPLAPPPLSVSVPKPVAVQPVEAAADSSIAASVTPPEVADKAADAAPPSSAPTPLTAVERGRRFLGKTRQHRPQSRPQWRPQPPKRAEDDARSSIPPNAPSAPDRPKHSTSPDDARVRRPVQPDKATIAQQLVEAQQNRLLGLRAEAEALADVLPDPAARAHVAPVGVLAESPGRQRAAPSSPVVHEPTAAPLPTPAAEAPATDADSKSATPQDSWPSPAPVSTAADELRAAASLRVAQTAPTPQPPSDSETSSVDEDAAAAAVAEWQAVRERWSALQKAAAEQLALDDETGLGSERAPARTESQAPKPGLLGRLFSRPNAGKAPAPATKPQAPRGAAAVTAQQTRLSSLREGQLSAPSIVEGPLSQQRLSQEPSSVAHAEEAADASLATPQSGTQSGAPIASLTFVAGPRTGDHVDLDGSPAIIGSASDAVVALTASESVAAAHARIWRHGSHFALKQLDGAGTTIAGAPLPMQVVVLDDGDVIGIGEHRLSFTSKAKPEIPTLDVGTSIPPATSPDEPTPAKPTEDA